ncbi:MAG: DUF5711 family protein [Clostridiales bacterium]|nr:DUF5711 family protein [Clostridiales bacterium]
MDEKENNEIIKKEDTPEKNKKKPLNLLRFIIIIAAAAVIIFLLVRIYHSFFSSTGGRIIGDCINTIGYEQGDKADFYTTGDGLYFVTKDGVIYMNKKGSAMKWQDTYTMMNPVVSGEGDIIGVSEKGGSLFAVYSTSGNLYKITADNSISAFAVNEKGGSVLITENDTEYTITAYTESGFTAFMAKSPIEEGLAIGCDISDDGRFLAVSYIYTGYTELESRVIFYNLKQSGDSNIDEEKEMVGSFVRSGEIMGIVRFMDGNSLIAVSSSEVVCVKLGIDGNSVTCSERWSVQAQNSIKALAFPGKKYVAVAYGEKNLNSETAEEENTVVVYNLNGREMSKTVMDKTIDGMFSDSSVITVKMNRSFQALDKSGGRILSYTVAQDVNKLLVYDGNSKALIVTPKGAYIMEIKSKGISTIISNIRNSDDEDSIGTETEDETEVFEEGLTEIGSGEESPAEGADQAAEEPAETLEDSGEEISAESEETEETEEETETETVAEEEAEVEETSDE